MDPNCLQVLTTIARELHWLSLMVTILTGGAAGALLWTLWRQKP